MRQITTNFVVPPPKQAPTVLRVTEPVRQMDMREKRRKRVAALSEIAHAIYGEDFARLASPNDR